MSDIIETIDWAISTIENKLMFGLDEKNAQFARDNRVKAVLRDCRKELKEKDKEIEKLKSKLGTFYYIKQLNKKLEIALEALDKIGEQDSDTIRSSNYFVTEARQALEKIKELESEK